MHYKYASVRVIFGGRFYFIILIFLYFGGICNETIIPLALVGYEMIIANSALCRRFRWLSVISYPTHAREIIVKFCLHFTTNDEKHS